jgi:pyruvate,water dikinase
LFTANPVNGRRDQMVIDGCWGLGEALVSGQVTPDHWAVSARTGAVLEVRVSRKEAMTARQETGTGLLPVPAAMREKPVLDGAQVAALTELGRRVAAHYGAPQDIEWALAQGRLYLVQARPITSLFPLPRPEPAATAGERVYVCLNVLQGLVEPFTPMGIAAFRTLLGGVAGLAGVRLRRGEAPPPFKVAAGRIYLDITPLLQNRTTRAVVLRGSGAIDRQVSAILRYLEERDLSAKRGRFPFRPHFGFLLRGLGHFFFVVLFPDTARARVLAKNGGRRACAGDPSRRRAGIGRAAAVR